MDQVLFDKLPSGGSWWNIQHVAKDSWAQRFYTRDPLEESQTEKPKTANMKFDSFIQEAPQTSPKQTVTNDVSIPIWKCILDVLDPCSSLYTREQFQDATDTVRTKFLSFVTGLAHPYFGPKKSRVLSSWLSNNKVAKENANIIQEFLVFIFEDKAANWTVVSGKRGEWLIKN